VVQPQTYEITFLGQAGTTLRAEFEDYEVIIGRGVTTLRTELPDSGALSGLVERITAWGSTSSTSAWWRHRPGGNPALGGGQHAQVDQPEPEFHHPLDDPPQGWLTRQFDAKGGRVLA
jgi:hypothetical protein